MTCVPKLSKTMIESKNVLETQDTVIFIFMYLTDILPTSLKMVRRKSLRDHDFHTNIKGH